ncbi:hypothetical protein M885DRAFT_530647 [Pelagophyceae sp. CCMP2097]|nr:hypothetical protein M885DRAFT_530647 [Pelagophyceae sp. CCMP2097]|mmetsp:Transcript_15880/g.53514  ORF Transcript_15880/g.53514 Transcript_15880/m.53514 type:complete len:444 (+) Transcript_15880:94-1425(+)
MTWRSGDVSMGRSLGKLGLFVVFGMGGSWWGTWLLWMELPVYTKHFGPGVANRISLSGNAGALTCGAYLLWKRHAKTRLPSPHALIWWTLAAQGFGVALLALATPGSACFTIEVLCLASFVTASVGYMAGFTVAPALVENYENKIYGVFNAGDGVASVVTALLSIAQFSDTQKPRFSPLACVLLLGLPVTACSALAFGVIQKTGCGRLQEPGDDAAPGHAPINATQDDEASENPMAAFKQVDDEPESPNIEVELVRRAWPAGPHHVVKPAARRGAFTLRLFATIVWVEFTGWGIADSIVPFACAAARDAGADGGRDCLVGVFTVTIFARLAAVVFATALPMHRVQRSLGASLWLPLLVFTAAFAALCLGAAAPPPLWTQRSCVFVVALLRFLGPYASELCMLLVQPSYAKEDHAAIPVLLSIAAIAGNLGGAATAAVVMALVS